MTPRQILTYGVDPQLLKSRALVLETAGFQAYTARELDEAERILAKEQIDLLVLCRSLPAEHCNWAASSARQLREEIKIIHLNAERGSFSSDRDVEVLDEAFVSPEVLLSAIAKLLGTPGTHRPASESDFPE